MTNPTSNFGWQMPTSTDLVTDLPADFEVFGQAVDTSLADLKGGTTGQILTKNSNTDMDFVWSSESGDISAVTAGTGLTGGGTSGAVTVSLDTASAYVVPSQTGNSGKYLTTNGTTSSWGTISSGGMTLIATSTQAATVTNFTFSSIPTTYKQLIVVCENLSSASASITSMNMVLNADTGNNYVYFYTNALSQSTTGITVTAEWGGGLNANVSPIMLLGNSGGGGYAMGVINIYNADSTGFKVITASTAAQKNTSSLGNYKVDADYRGTSAISSIKLTASNNITGTFKLYGVA